MDELKGLKPIVTQFDTVLKCIYRGLRYNIVELRNNS